MANTQAPHVQKRPGPGKGNRRTGSVRGTHSGIRRGTLDWHKDAEALARIQNGQELALMGWSVPQVAERQGVSVETVYADKRRARELAQTRVLGTLAEIVAKLRWAQVKAEDALANLADRPFAQNIPALINTHRQAVMDELKALGLEPANRLKVEGELIVSALDATALNRPEVRVKLDALYDALNGVSEPADVGESFNGSILALPAAPEAHRARPARSDSGA
ncbi:MAG: hypothetical protein WBF51_04295 [Candidatus Dormiibacterota bacterium]